MAAHAHGGRLLRSDVTAAATHTQDSYWLKRQLGQVHHLPFPFPYSTLLIP
jgi:hypothetical protein